jgi:hypothetical protein
VGASQLGLTGGAQLIFFPNPRKTSIQLLLEAQQYKKYAQTTPLYDEFITRLLPIENPPSIFGGEILKEKFSIF